MYDEDFDEADLEPVYNPQFYKLRIAALKYCYNKFKNIKITFYSGDVVQGKVKGFTDDEFTIVIPVNDNLNEYVVQTYPVSEIRITEYIDDSNDNITTLIEDFNQKS